MQARATATIALGLLCLGVAGQNETCETATPFPTTLPACKSFAPQDTAVVCWSFIAPTTSLLIDAVTTSSCVTVQREYVWYDGECTEVDRNTSGVFFPETGMPYTFCVEVVCEQGNGIQQVCIFEPLPLYAKLLLFEGGQRGSYILLRWLAVEYDHEAYRIRRSMDMVRWEDDAWISSDGPNGEVTEYRWITAGWPGVNYFRIYDQDDVLLAQAAVPFLFDGQVPLYFNVLGQIIR